MRELERLLKEREAHIGFTHSENQIRCYAHIINICSRHIVASMTSTSKGSNHVTSNSNVGSDDDHDGEDNSDHDIVPLAKSLGDQGDSELN